jgi:polar amino acid transport system substrate-binding protein
MARTLFLGAFLLILQSTTACTVAPTAVSIPPSPLPQTTEIPIATIVPTTSVALLPDLKGRALKVGSDSDYPPFETIDDKKQVVGFDVDLINEICKRINCKATFITTDLDFDGLVTALQNKSYDMSASGWRITDDRSKTVDFGLPYMPNTQGLVVRSDETLIKEPDDLKKPGVIVAAQKGTSNSASAKKLVADPNKQVKEYDELSAAVQALLNKQVQAIVVYTFAASDLIDQNQGKIRTTGAPFGDEYLGLVFRKGDKETKDAFNAGVKAVYVDGTWSKFCDKWWKDAIPKPDCTGKALPIAK